MILVDTSALIEYYRPGGKASARDAVAEAISADQAAVNGIIQVEILAFARGDKDRAALRADFGGFHWFELTRAEFELAAELGFGLRQRATTVPATDLIIAASAIRNGATLIHLDAHFDRIAERSRLRARNLG